MLVMILAKSGPETCRHPEGKKTTEKGEIKNLEKLLKVV